MDGDLHVVFGAGPAGSWTARALRDMGLRTRVVNRSGRRGGLVPADVAVVAADATVPAQAVAAAAGASVVYQALGVPYDRWTRIFPQLQQAVLGAAEATGARYVSVDNLYAYGHVDGEIRADSPANPCSVKGRLRAAMAQEVLQAHHRGTVQALILRSADYYGPGVLTSAFGAEFFGPLVTGRAANLLGRGDLPHAVAYIEDVGLAAATLGVAEDAFGQVWLAPHAPAVTQLDLVNEAARTSGGRPRARTVGPVMARLAGLASGKVRSSVEMLYQFTSPFLVDSAPIQDAFGLSPTPIDVGVRRTVQWFQARAADPRTPC